MLSTKNNQILINENRRRLQKLYEHKARNGISTSPEVLNEIEDLERVIKTLENEAEAKLKEPINYESFISLIEAMGYEILDKQQLDAANIFLFCQIKLGIETQNYLISLVLRDIQLDHYGRLRGAISKSPYSKILICQTSIPPQVKELAKQDNIRVYSYDELVAQVIDFKPYLNRVIAEYNDSEAGKYYTNIHCISNDGLDMPIDHYVEQWLVHPRYLHLSVLGSFGSGKTWFCRNLVAVQAERCLQGKSERIPILVTLRDYSKAYDIIQVITDLFANRLKIKLSAGYDTFDFLNRSGRFLLVFDGLDEMERRISDYQSVTENFWELARVAKHEKSKVILTCRNTYFKDEVEEKEVLIKGGKIINVVGGEKVIEIGGETPYTTVSLKELSIQEIKEILGKRLGDGMDEIWNAIQSSPDLFDLARRPSLIDMLIRVIPDMKSQKEKFSLNLTKLFELYTQQSFKRYEESDSTIKIEERLSFLQELSWEMFATQQTSVNWSAFPALVDKHFNLNASPQSILFYEKAFRTQSYLSRDEHGNYSFAHKSFMEFFVARKIFKLLSKVTITPETQIPELDREFASAFGQFPFAIEIRNFIKQFLQEDDPTEKNIREKLNNLVYATSRSPSQLTNYIGGNAVSILHMLGESFRDRDLNNTILKKADLRNADLTKTNFTKANLHGVILSNAILNEANFTNADLSEISLEQMKTVNSIDWSPTEDRLVVSCEDPNIKVFNIKSQMEGKKDDNRPMVLFGHEYPVLSVSWSPTGKFIASIDSERNIIVWSSHDFSIIKKWQILDLSSKNLEYQPGHISRQIFFSKNQDDILVGNSQLLILLRVTQDSPMATLIAKEGFVDFQMDAMTISRDDWLGQMDWKIKYANGQSLSRLQHKNIAFEQRSLIINLPGSSTILLSEQKAQDAIASMPVVGSANNRLIPGTEAMGYIAPGFANSVEAINLDFKDATTATYSPSRKFLAYGSNSKVTIAGGGFFRCELDLSLSCHNLQVKGATGLPPSALLALRSKGVELDEKQVAQWRVAMEETKTKTTKTTGYLKLPDSLG